jgi:hypothetical protein
MRVFSTKLASQHEAGYTISSARSWHHSTRLATQHHQHEAGITARGWQHIITARGWHIIITRLAHIITHEAGIIISTRLAHHHSTRLAHHHHRLASQHEAGTSSQHEAGIIITTRLAHHHSTRLAHHHTRGWHHQHEAGITTLGWHIIIMGLASQHYSPFRGRSLRTTPSLSRKCSNFTRDRGLVNTSTTCSSVLTYWSFMAPLCTISRM